MSLATLPLIDSVAPPDVAAVAEVIRDADENSRPVYPVGGRTQIDLGLPPSEPGIGLSVSRLDRLIDHAAADMTITVEAGMRVSDLQRRLAEKGQWLPVDIAQPDRATIGGAVAAGAFGPRRFGYATLRDYVIGLTAANGCGTTFSAGGRVVKNAAGYDLCRLMVGSLGTLGVITQLTLMVRPRPETQAMVVAEVSDLDAAERLLAALVHTKTLPVSIDLLAGTQPRSNPVLSVGSDESVRLVVGFQGPRATIDWMVRTVHDEWREAGVAAIETLAAEPAEAMCQWMRDRSSTVQVHVLPGHTVDVVAKFLELDAEASVHALAGNGIVRARFSPSRQERFAELLRGQLRPAVDALGGNLIVLKTPEGVQLALDDVWNARGMSATISQAIRDRFDPRGILNRGRFC